MQSHHSPCAVHFLDANLSSTCTFLPGDADESKQFPFEPSDSLLRTSCCVAYSLAVGEHLLVRFWHSDYWYNWEESFTEVAGWVSEESVVGDPRNEAFPEGTGAGNPLRRACHATFVHGAMSAGHFVVYFVMDQMVGNRQSPRAIVLGVEFEYHVCQLSHVSRLVPELPTDSLVDGLRGGVLPEG